jgi:hypothetical protein
MIAAWCVYKKLSYIQLLIDALVADMLGQKFLEQYVTLPAVGTRGGIILACSKDFYTLSQVDIRSFSVTVTITRRVDRAS